MINAHGLRYPVIGVKGISDGDCNRKIWGKYRISWSNDTCNIWHPCLLRIMEQWWDSFEDTAGTTVGRTSKLFTAKIMATY